MQATKTSSLVYYVKLTAKKQFFFVCYKRSCYNINVGMYYDTTTGSACNVDFFLQQLASGCNSSNRKATCCPLYSIMYVWIDITCHTAPFYNLSMLVKELELIIKKDSIKESFVQTASQKIFSYRQSCFILCER